MSNPRANFFKDQAEETTRVKENYSFFKIPKVRSPKHLAWLATLPCYIEGLEDETCVGHHLLKAGGHGIAEKECDSLTITLTGFHHDHLHRNGNEVAYLANNGRPYLNMLYFIRERNKKSPCKKIRECKAVDIAIERQQRIEGLV